MILADAKGLLFAAASVTQVDQAIQPVVALGSAQPNAGAAPAEFHAVVLP